MCPTSLCRFVVRGSVSSCYGFRPWGITVLRSSSLYLPVWCQDSLPCPPPEGPVPLTPLFTTLSPLSLMVNRNTLWIYYEKAFSDDITKGIKNILSWYQLNNLAKLFSVYLKVIYVSLSSEGGTWGDHPTCSSCGGREGCRWPNLLRPWNSAQVHDNPGKNLLFQENRTVQCPEVYWITFKAVFACSC